MAKFKIRIGGELPPFKLPVTFTCPDGKDATINMTVKHHSTDEMKEFYESEEKAPKGNVDFIRFMAEGWDLDEEFTDENISWLCSHYPSFVMALPQTYMAALAGHRAKV